MESDGRWNRVSWTLRLISRRAYRDRADGRTDGRADYRRGPISPPPRQREASESRAAHAAAYVIALRGGGWGWRWGGGGTPFVQRGDKFPSRYAGIDRIPVYTWSFASAATKETERERERERERGERERERGRASEVQVRCLRSCFFPANFIEDGIIRFLYANTRVSAPSLRERNRWECARQNEGER